MSWPSGDEEYRKAWREYVRRRDQWAIAAVIFLSLMLLPAFFALGEVWRGDSSVLFASRFIETTWEILLGLAFIAVAITGVRGRYWRCPRCGNPFGQRYWWFSGGLMLRCAHCGLRRDYVKSVADGKAHSDATDY
jgi:uncharacterized C2H2 Zn-finger protein